RLRTVPGDELANRMVVRPLAADGREAAQHGGLGVFELGSASTRLGGFFLRDFSSGIGLLDRRRGLHSLACCENSIGSRRRVTPSSLSCTPTDASEALTAFDVNRRASRLLGARRSVHRWLGLWDVQSQSTSDIDLQILSSVSIRRQPVIWNVPFSQ